MHEGAIFSEQLSATGKKIIPFSLPIYKGVKTSEIVVSMPPGIFNKGEEFELISFCVFFTDISATTEARKFINDTKVNFTVNGFDYVSVPLYKALSFFDYEIGDKFFVNGTKVGVRFKFAREIEFKADTCFSILMMGNYDNGE